MESSKIKILAIDDNQDNLVSLKALINEAFPDTTTLTASNGTKGIELATTENPDVILLDIVMPGMDGFEVCKKLKADKMLCDIPVVFVTAIKGDKESRIRALECGAEAFLAKPIDESELTAQIRAMVKIKQANTYKLDENKRLATLVEQQTAELRKAYSATLKLLEDLHTENNAREKSEAHTKGILQTAMDGFLMVDLKGKFIEVNDVACKMVGYTREEMLKFSISDLEIVETAEQTQKHIQKVIDNGEDRFQSKYRCKNGETIDVELSVKMQPALNLMVVFVRDITERKQAEEKLRTREAKFRAVAELSPIAIYASSGSDQKGIYVNETFYKIFGFSMDDVPTVGHWWIKAFPDEKYRQQVIDQWTYNIEQAEKNNTDVEALECVCTCKDGSEKIIVWVGKTIGDEFWAFGYDTTERKQAENELIKAKEHAEESDRLKTAFLQNMSHEIRTPMNAIMGFSEMLVKNYNNKPKLEKFTGIITQRCADLLDIINDLLDIAKIESGQLPVSIEKCNLNVLFAELTLFFKEYQNRIGKQQITFSLHSQCNPSNAFITTDKGKLKQIFINLIINAFKFTEAGTIEGGCKFDTNGNLIFYVSDTGIGIQLDKQKMIFERFTQVEQSTNRLYGGTGLGLSIVKGLVGLLGGEMFVESQFAKGSTFSFTIPYKAIPELPIVSLVNEEPAEYKFSNKTILIVEDDLYNAEYLKEILSEVGINTFHAAYGAEAVQLSLAKPVDLVLMDIRLPDMDGYQATRQIRQHKPQLKIIAQTAYASHDEKQKALNAGCDDYISKPTKQELLLSMLNKHL